METRDDVHTFHLSVGEATITLRDVAMITNLLVGAQSPLLVRVTIKRTNLGCLGYYDQIKQWLGIR